VQVLAHLISCLVIGLLGDGAPLWGSVTRFKWRWTRTLRFATTNGHRRTGSLEGGRSPSVAGGLRVGEGRRAGEERRAGEGQARQGKARQGEASKEAHVSKVGREERRQGGREYRSGSKQPEAASNPTFSLVWQSGTLAVWQSGTCS
jgi:hypothetical protein